MYLVIGEHQAQAQIKYDHIELLVASLLQNYELHQT